MEDYRLIGIDEDEEVVFEDEDYDEEDYDEDEDVEELFPAVIMPSRNSFYIFEDDDYDDDDYEEEEGEELNAREEDDEDDEEEGEEDYEEEEERGEFIAVEMTSPRVSSLFSDGRTLQGAVVINDGLVEDADHSESGEAKSGNQELAGGDGGEGELKRGEIDGLFCPICFEAWTSGGGHQICCLPCGHIYGLSCIKKWLQRCRSSGKCPQCNSLCTLKDVRVLYATRLFVADEELHKRVRSLEAKCAHLEQKVLSQAPPLTPEELIHQICNNPPLLRQLATALGELQQQQDFP